MKRIFSCVGLTAILALSIPASSQVVQNPPREASHLNHGDFSVYGDMFRVSPKNYPTLNFLGLGGRVGFNVHPNVALEGEMNYDFEQNYTTVQGTGASSTTITSGVRPLTGLFGPKFQFGTSGPFRAFLTGKAGFVEWSTSGKSPSGSTFTGAFGQFGSNSTNFAAYPGGGIEAYLGPLGLRVEAGDEIYLDNGAHNNLRVTFGPSFRF
ncbi:hypothetical protein DYQ86_26050 [Acidobacteria bacterium AB60]|nr:hypothetical protein DYQ86_26050 [Acidobacteria bacterium AB60]